VKSLTLFVFLEALPLFRPRQDKPWSDNSAFYLSLLPGRRTLPPTRELIRGGLRSSCNLCSLPFDGDGRSLLSPTFSPSSSLRFLLLGSELCRELVSLEHRLFPLTEAVDSVFFFWCVPHLPLTGVLIPAPNVPFKVVACKPPRVPPPPWLPFRLDVRRDPAGRLSSSFAADLILSSFRLLEL